MVFNKKIAVLVFMMTVALVGRAQETVRVMLEQLAALKGYASTIEEGYRIVGNGLRLIGDVKGGEFSLHQAYFGSLRVVDDGVLDCPSLAEAYGLIDAIDREYGRALPVYAASGWLRSDEEGYLLGLREKLADQGRKDREALGQLTGDGVLSMTDGERLRGIGVIAGDVRVRFGGVKNFLTGIAWLIAQRRSEGVFIGTLKKWYGIQ